MDRFLVLAVQFMFMGYSAPRDFISFAQVVLSSGQGLRIEWGFVFAYAYFVGCEIYSDC